MQNKSSTFLQAACTLVPSLLSLSQQTGAFQRCTGNCSYSGSEGIWGVDFNFFFCVCGDKGMHCRREASAAQRTPSPSVASQADSLLTVQRLITGHGK